MPISHNSETHGNKKSIASFVPNVTHTKVWRKAAEQYTKSKIRGFCICILAKAVVGVMQALTEEDNVLCTYREHGHA
jgi:TPP-dependent pyruvate/acetoin dehydrogenase alpha subunit